MEFKCPVCGRLCGVFSLIETDIMARCKCGNVFKVDMDAVRRNAKPEELAVVEISKILASIVRYYEHMSIDELMSMMYVLTTAALHLTAKTGILSLSETSVAFMGVPDILTLESHEDE